MPGLTLPASTLGKACRYTLTLWRKLTRFLEYPELELSNNLRGELHASRSRLAGKTGSTSAAPRPDRRSRPSSPSVESCRRMNIPVREYLAAVLPGLNNLSIQNLANSRPQPGPQPTLTRRISLSVNRVFARTLTLQWPDERMTGPNLRLVDLPFDCCLFSVASKLKTLKIVGVRRRMSGACSIATKSLSSKLCRTLPDCAL